MFEVDVSTELPEPSGADMTVWVVGDVATAPEKEVLSQAFQDGLHLANFKIPEGGVRWILAILSMSPSIVEDIGEMTNAGYFVGRELPNQGIY